MQTITVRYDVRGIAAPDTAFLSLTPAPVPPRPTLRHRFSRSFAWHLAAVLSLLFSSSAYAVYALLHLRV